MAETTQDTPQDGDQQQLKGTTIKTDGIQFEAIERDGLGAVPVLSQAFDNQWLPRSLLQEALKAGEVTSELEHQCEELARAEYVRSLINGEQVVINRAYIYNNEIIYQDYLPAKNSSDFDEVRRARDSREAFKRLLQNRVIVPYLFTEKSPLQPPKFSTRSFEEWEKVCQQAPGMQCIRLSWDDDQNDEYTSDFLAGRFASFALSLVTKNLDKYLRDLGLDPSAKDEFRKQLHKVAQMALDLQGQKGTVTREDLYHTFIAAPGTTPAERRYDYTKPFAGEIKQLLDLAYSRNLPDALDGYLLTPIDSLPRTALQETADELTGRLSNITVQDIMTMLQRTVFSLVQDGLYLPSLDLLSLPDVDQIRGMNEWYDYIAKLKALLADPIPSFAQGGAQAVQESYARLADQMTKLIGDRYAQDMTKSAARTTFVIELVIEIGAGLISLVGMPPPVGPIIQVVGAAALATAGKKALPFAVRFVVRDIASKRANKGLSNSMELMRGKMREGAQQWEELLRRVRETRVFEEGQVSPDKAAELTPPNPVA